MPMYLTDKQIGKTQIGNETCEQYYSFLKEIYSIMLHVLYFCDSQIAAF